MKFSSKIKSFSFIFLIVVLLLNSIDLTFNLHLENILSLNPQRILQDYEFWRLLSFPFILTNTGFVFIFAAVFLFLSPILENYLNRYLYPVFLFLAVMLQGFILTLVFWNDSLNIGGLEGLSFFVLSLLVFLKPNDRLFRFLPMNVSTISIFLLVMWLMSVVLPATGSENFSIAETSAGAIFGISLGLTIFFPIKYMERYLRNRRKLEAPKIRIPKPEELSMAMMSAANLQKIYHQFEEESYLVSDNEEENEIILNDILDKINLEGRDSLHSDEIRFLNDYSRRLQ